jgi:hypothetical protein
METTLAVNVDGMCAAWARMDGPIRGESDPGDVAGGVLTGDHELVERIRAALTDEVEVRVLHPNVYYQFTEGRGTDADIAAAMLSAGRGRALLSDSGWDALIGVLDLPDDDGEGDDVVY